MDLAHPMHSVIPSVQGDVLAVLARTQAPLTGRGVAALIDGRASISGVKVALRALVASGLVTGESHPPAMLYRLNRQHLAAESIEELANLRGRLLSAMRSLLSNWVVHAWGAWLFGSAARGDGNVESEIDVLIVRGDGVHAENETWRRQLDEFAAATLAWTGNDCRVIEFTESEFRELLASPQRLSQALRDDGIALTARRISRQPRELVD